MLARRCCCNGPSRCKLSMAEKSIRKRRGGEREREREREREKGRGGEDEEREGETLKLMILSRGWRYQLSVTFGSNLKALAYCSKNLILLSFVCHEACEFNN